MSAGGKSDEPQSSPEAMATSPQSQTPDRTCQIGPATGRGDRVVRVFVSSTFSDMIEDRNELMTHVCELRRMSARGRAVEVVDVDLRWGADRRAGMAERDSAILPCRDHPLPTFFIGLLGEHSWVPSPDAYPPDLLNRSLAKGPK